jgi:hypothetical protein
MHKGLLLGAVTVLAACSYHPIKTITPVDSEGFWRQGVRFVESSQSDSVVLLGYSRYDKIGYVFDAVIRNNSQQPQEFFPTRITCHQFNGSNALIRSTPAVDPEEKLAQVTRQLQLNQEQPLGLALLSIADNTASLVDHPDTLEEWDVRQEENAREDAAEAREQAERLNLERQRDMYSKEFLRNHSLAPGETIAGKIVCARLTDGTQRLEIEVPIGGVAHKLAWNATLPETL